MRISQPENEKKCWKGAPFSKGNLSWNIWVKDILAFCDSEGPLPPIGPSCRGTQIILISSIYGMHRYENFVIKLWKKKGLERAVLKLPFFQMVPLFKGQF